jgi:putative two-component system response regulator
MINAKILIVEDEWVIADQLCRNLEDFGYRVCPVVSSGDEAITKADAERPDLILMDIVLKGRMDGIEAASHINAQFDIPIIYLTSYINPEYIERAKQTKPFGYLVKPHDQSELYACIEMALNKHKVEKEISDCLDRLRVCYKGALKVVSGAIELRGPYAPGHHRRVAEFVHAIAREMGLSDFSIEGACLTAYVFDIGLVNMPVSIIQDSGRLTGVRKTLYCKYPQWSHDILAEVDFPWPVAEIVLQHCECFDGSGFPRGIKGEDILIEARILSVAVAIEELTSYRSYRDPFSLKQALDEISAHRGSKYDPNVVDVYLKLFKEKEP